MVALMFTTGSHNWLMAAAGGYAAALAFFLFRRQALGKTLLAAGVVLHTLSLIGRGWRGGVFIFNALVEGPFFLPWCLAAIALGRCLLLPREKGGAWLPGLALVFTACSLFYSQGLIPPTPNKLTAWAALFFMSESMAHALFYTAALHACLALFGKEAPNTAWSWLVWGFVLYTLAQVSGAIWCFVGWGNTFSWSSRHLGSATLWMFFAACLHLQFIADWRRRIPLFTVAGGLLVFFISFAGYLREMQFPRWGG